MLGDRITVDRGFGGRILAFLANPFVTIVTGVVISIFFYVISIDKKLPYYYVTKPKQVAYKALKSLDISFDNRSITNLYFIDLVLWNNGNQFIDYNDFIETKPVQLTVRRGGKILVSKLIIRSRDDLQFKSQIVNNHLIIKMLGDEAIEQNDGAVFRVYYTGKNLNSGDFTLVSRIKGTRDGFKYVNVTRLIKTKHLKYAMIGWGILITLISFRSIVLLIAKKPIIFRRLEIMVITMITILLCYYTYECIYYTVDLSWYEGISKL